METMSESVLSNVSGYFVLISATPLSATNEVILRL